MRQEYVLLCFIEAVQLIHKKNGLLPVQRLARFGLRYFFTDIAHVGFYSVEHDKVGAGLFGNDRGQRCFAHTGRAVENQG